MMADWRAGMNLTLPRTYALADAVNHLSNNMNATAPSLGEVVPARRRGGDGVRPCGNAGRGSWRGLPFRRGVSGDRVHGFEELHDDAGERLGHDQGTGRSVPKPRFFRNAARKGHAERRAGHDLQGTGGRRSQTERASDRLPDRDVRAGIARSHRTAPAESR